MAINIIVGPPCAGKSRFVKESASEGDVIVDYDELAKALGSVVSHAADGPVRQVAFAARDAAVDRILEGIEGDAWVIHTRPNEKNIGRYTEVGAIFTLLDPGKDVCLERAEADQRPEATSAVIEEWYENPPVIPISKRAKSMQNRAYSVLTVKTIDDAKRIIRGTATTPTVDRVGDIIDPLGVKFQNPLAFLWQHQHDKPIGSVKFDKPTAKGIGFEAEFAHPDTVDSASLKERLQEAWDSVKIGLVKAVSIGFRPIEYSFMDNGGIRYSESEVYELSAVTIPANSDALISTIKSIDAAVRHEAGIPDPEIPANPEPAATGNKARVVKLEQPARDGAKPFVVKKIVRTA